MATTGATREEELDGLYALPLDRFTAARDELARRLRRGGERDAADEIKRLGRPSVPAWALTQVRRSDPRSVDELIAAAERLRDAQQRLLAAGDREAHRRATG